RHESELAGDRAIEFLQSNATDRPFCLSVSFNAVHAEDGDKRPGIGHYPWPAAVDGMYDDVTVPPPRLSEPEIFESQPDLLKTSLNRERFFWRWDTPEKYQTNIRAYFRMISGVDRVIGRVLEELDRQGAAEDTVVIYSGDNGYYMGQRGFAGKWSHYEESLRVPLVIHDPRLSDSQRGRVLECVALNIDLPATFLDLAGVASPEHYQGRSLLSWVRGEAVADWRGDFFCEHLMDAPGRIPKWEGVRGRRYVYARYFEDNYEFLHDLEVDPDQLKNFAKDPEYTTVLAETRRRSDELRDCYGGPYVPRPRPEKRRKKPAAKEGATFSDGVIDQSALFDGRSYLTAGKLPALKPGDDFSWSFWVRLEPGHRRQGVLIGNRATGEPGSTTFIKFTSHGLQYYGAVNQSRRLSYDLPQNRWTHLAAVKKEDSLTCYVNGAPVGDATVDFDLPELPFYLGGDPLAGELSACSLDEVRTYRRALTPEEVRALSQKQSIDEGLDGHWPLDGNN
ncbi:MAG: sulfatase-like hydrolase/transferase, partial [Planctomycetes bacterium]|nr:sulfatase-like hydrolase/transferase [Planctomycetota bacterium]